ncbi:hypothetical protein [Mesobacillus selenatarsenatis]|uniref:Uncharacterized protein n=1 Tax=Mesobacillus selenatarsenatis TaxID=388741 RepID=A0A846T7V6_9BACI|nr:hypothetical protein [Mesobacillus selenatarsenatis]NKE04713.1 hypothetical protein [Mesobacillus selenatarsenatis]
MKYFILYISYSPDFTQELYMKSKSMKHLLERIGRYSNGCLATSQGNINTNQVLSIYAREINPSSLNLNKTKFATINENKSYNAMDLA